MSSLINIYIPKRNAISIGSKESSYIASNVLNTAAQIGTTIAGQIARRSLYGKALRYPKSVFDEYSDLLRADSGNADNNVILRTEKDVEIEFINAKIGVQKKNKIVSTALVNRTGKVKELIQADDYSVRISGDLIGERDKFPYRDLHLLNQILSETGSIEVASAYLCIFDINKMVFQNADFNQENLRYFNVMPFVLNFESDMDYHFLINE